MIHPSAPSAAPRPNGGAPASPARATFLPFFRPWIDEREIDEVVDTLRSGWLTMGPKTIQFEQKFAAEVGAKHALAVNSCTAGLHLALDVAGIQPGDEVITTPYTFAATANVVLHLRARPVLVDVLPDTMTMDPGQLEKAMTSRTRAVVPVHMAGYPCDLDAIRDIAQRHGALVIEDAAHALPTRYKGRLVGSLSDMTVFSFYAGKNITTGEGGMVTTESDRFADLLRTRRLHGISRDAWKRYTSEGSWYYEVDYPGYKYNMTDLNAALGLRQLEKLSMFHAVRHYYAGVYQLGLGDMPEIALPPPAPDLGHAWHLYVVQLELARLAITREQFVNELHAQNIGTSVHFIPLHVHPYYRNLFGYQPEDFPNTWHAYRRAISLPLYPRMSEADVWDVVRAVRGIVERHRRGRAA